MRDLTALDTTLQSLCITYCETKSTFELKKNILIHLLPSFKEFHIFCDGMHPQGVTKEHINMRAFPFCLKDDAKDWLYFLSTRNFTIWKEMKNQFLEKFSLLIKQPKSEKKYMTSLKSQRRHSTNIEKGLNVSVQVSLITKFLVNF